MKTKRITPPTGKLPPEALERNILNFTGMARPEVLVGPRVGEDAAVVGWPAGRFLVASSDPIVGATEGAGKILVHVNANDIASKGGVPLYLIVTLILPHSLGEEGAGVIMKDIDAACREMGVAIIGGHTEFTDRYEYPVLVGTMLGEANRVLRAGDICPGDVVLMTKHVGIEGMTILAADRPDLLEPVLGSEDVKTVERWSSLISVLPEALVLREKARFMHDPTEGGLLGGLGEISRLAGLGVELCPESVSIHPLTVRSANALHFDPLRLISSGVLLAVLSPDDLEHATAALAEAAVPHTVIGRFVEGPGNCDISMAEELWRLLDMKRSEA